jgi:hypothetical protein
LSSEPLELDVGLASISAIWMNHSAQIKEKKKQEKKKKNK